MFKFVKFAIIGRIAIIAKNIPPTNDSLDITDDK